MYLYTYMYKYVYICIYIYIYLYIVPTGSPLTQGLLAVGHRFYEEKKGTKKGQGGPPLGSPHVALWRELVALLIEEKDATRDGEVLAAHAMRLDDAEYLEARVFCCRVSAAYQADRTNPVLPKSLFLAPAFRALKL